MLKPPFDRDGILAVMRAFCDATEILPADIVITAGAACVLHGLRPTTNDVDIFVPPERVGPLWRRLDTVRKPVALGVTVAVWRGVVEAMTDGLFDHNPSILVDGFRVLDPPSLLRQYEALNRPKDQEILEKLRGLQLEVKQAIEHFDRVFHHPV